MNKTFKDALKHRRSYYGISNFSPVTDIELESIIDHAVLNTPSAFNSQSTRVVLLLARDHDRFWEIVMEELVKIVPAANFEPTRLKIDSFAAGYGTVLYYEDQLVVRNLQERYPLYADNFPVWSDQTSAMHQFVIWTMLEDAGLGASLQHYGELVDRRVREIWSIPENWKLIAQMPFGAPISEPKEKSFEPLEKRVLVFGARK